MGGQWTGGVLGWWCMKWCAGVFPSTIETTMSSLSSSCWKVSSSHAIFLKRPKLCSVDCWPKIPSDGKFVVDGVVGRNLFESLRIQVHTHIGMHTHTHTHTHTDVCSEWMKKLINEITSSGPSAGFWQELLVLSVSVRLPGLQPMEWELLERWLCPWRAPRMNMSQVLFIAW